MVYYFNFMTGKIVDKSERAKSNIISNKNGWTPYYNLAGKYAGFKSGKKQIDKHLKYHNPKLKSWVGTYEELDWDIAKTLSEILGIDKERAEIIIKIELIKFKTEDNTFKAIENIKNNDAYETCEEKMLAVYSASIANVIKTLSKE